jgi:hypothetical protein
MTNCCGNPDCTRPFGLIRFSWGFEQFCSTKCRAIHKRQRERNNAYWKWLYRCPEPSVAHQKQSSDAPGTCFETFLTVPQREMSSARQSIATHPQSRPVHYGNRAG